MCFSAFALSARYTCHSPPECDNCTGLNWCSDETWLQDDARRQEGNYRTGMNVLVINQRLQDVESFFFAPLPS